MYAVVELVGSAAVGFVVAAFVIADSPVGFDFQTIQISVAVGWLVVARQRMVLFPNVDVDATSNDSFGRMPYRIHTHVYAMYNCRLDVGDYVAIYHVWQQILCHNSGRNVFLVSAVDWPQRHSVVAPAVAEQRPDDDVADDVVECSEWFAVAPLVQRI